MRYTTLTKWKKKKPIDAERVFDKVQHPCMIKTFNKICIEETYLNTTKVIHENPTANMKINRGKLRAFSWRFSTRQECQLLPVLFNIALDILARANRQEIESKNICKRKTSLCFCFTTILHFWHQMCGFSTHQVILRYQLGFLQFNLILSLYSWR